MTVMTDKIVEKTDDILFEHLSASINICDGLIIHHKYLLIHSKKNDEEGRYCQNFSILTN